MILNIVNMKLPKNIKFFLTHLLISFSIAVFVACTVLFLWNPAPLAKAVGVTHILFMVLIIDMILGPLLGFLVYKEGKKSLKFDLSVIILIQISALLYGIYSIAQGRPVGVIYSVDRFELVRANDIVSETEKASLPWLGPQFSAVQYSIDPKKKNDETFAEVLGRVSLTQRPERYIPLSKVKSQFQRASQDINLLNNFNSKKQVAKILKKYPNANAWLPLKANAMDMVVLINKETAEVVKIVDLRPWY